MFSLVPLKKKPLVGLDINSEEIRVIQLKHSKHTMRVEKLAMSELPVGVFVNGKIKDASIIKDILKQLVRFSNIEGYSCAIALPTNSIITKRIKLSASLTETERETEIMINLNKYFPGISAELCFDFVNMGTIDTEYYDVLIATARQEEIKDYINLICESGLNVKIVDVELFALARAVIAFQATRQTLAILDVKPTITQFIAIQNQEIVFHQQFVISDPKLIEQELIQQLKNAMQICLSTHRTLIFDSLILSGKMNFLSLLADGIQKECALKTEYANPFSAMIFSSTINVNKLMHMAPCMLISCGLALRR